MTANLFAACNHNGDLVARRIRLNANIQSSVAELFHQQENDFRQQIEDEIEFDGGWKPESTELFTIPIPTDAEIFEEAVIANASSIQDIDISSFEEMGIKAVFMGFNIGRELKILIQKFTATQILQRRFSLFQEGNSFNRLITPAFSLESNLTCIIENGKIKFKSLQNLRSIINMKDIYREATEPEVRDFAKHNILEISDIEDFIQQTDQTARKLITAILKSNTLNIYTPEYIVSAASGVGIIIETHNGKILVPSHKADFKNLLRFLDAGIYKDPLSGDNYMANSKKKMEK